MVSRRAPILVFLPALAACGSFISTDIFGDDDDAPAAPSPTATLADAGEEASRANGQVSGVDAGPDSGVEIQVPTPTTLAVFVTNDPYPANFGGIDAADLLCQNEAAQSADLKGRTFRAWLAPNDRDAGLLPWNRIKSVDPAEYRTLDGKLLSTSLVELAREAKVVGITVTPTDVVVVGPDPTPVWTGLDWNALGRMAIASPDNCKEWTLSESSVKGAGGTVCKAVCLSTWFAGNPGLCTEKRRLYCVEEPT